MKIIDTITNTDYIKQTVDVLRQGGLVVAPSDTVYGLLVDAKNEQAVRKLLAFKNRPIGKPISIFLQNLSNVTTYAELNTKQIELLKQFIPGPFTVVLPSKHIISPLLESERGTVGVRVIEYTVIQNIVSQFDSAVTATSANISGKKPHHSLDAFLATLSEKKKDLIDLVLDAGTLPRNKPSTVVDLSGSDIKVLRKGDIVLSTQSSYLSTSTDQTKKIGLHLVKKYMSTSNRPLVFIIEGDLGVGKTILVKGIAEAFGINNIISPTFVIYYEYPISHNPYREFIHLDLYNIQETEEFKHLGIESYLNEKNVLCFEWGERMGKLYDEIKSKADVVYVRMNHKSENEREIQIMS